MRIPVTIGRLLTVIAVIGLTVGPFVRPVAATGILQQQQTSSEMDSGMSCCPDEEPSNNCAKTCPLMAVCMTVALQAMLPAACDLPSWSDHQAIALTPDDIRSGHPTGPPYKPPKA